MIRTIAYRSQLKSARAQLHRRLATALEARDPASTEENAALIAEHLEASGDLSGAFGWHMRAGNWLTFRDINAARLSWMRARQVADRLPTDDPGREAIRIAPRALLCASAFRIGGAIDEPGFEELCRLAGAADDKVSLAIAMAGHVAGLAFHGRYHESSQLASELTGLIESIGDPMLTVGLLPAAINAKIANGEIAETLRLALCVIDLADGDPHMGDLILESPVTVARMGRAAGQLFLGTSGWKQEMEQATAMCREFLPIGQAVVQVWSYAFGVLAGAVRSDATAVQEAAEILKLAEQQGDDLSLECARFLHGFILAQREGLDRDRGLSLLAEAREAAAQQRSLAVFVPLIDIEFAKEKARAGDFDDAVGLLQTVLENEIASGGVSSYARAAVVLVESLLERGKRADVQAAKAVIGRLAAMAIEPGIVVFEIALLRLRALLARARGDDADYRHFVDRYHAMATELGFEGHIAMAETMT